MYLQLEVKLNMVQTVKLNLTLRPLSIKQITFHFFQVHLNKTDVLQKYSGLQPYKASFLPVKLVSPVTQLVVFSHQELLLSDLR